MNSYTKSLPLIYVVVGRQQRIDIAQLTRRNRYGSRTGIFDGRSLDMDKLSRKMFGLYCFELVTKETEEAINHAVLII